MAGFKDKLQVFFLGLLLGIILGGAFFLLKIDQYLKELSFNLARNHRTETTVEKQDKKEEPQTEKNLEKPRSFAFTGSHVTNSVSDSVKSSGGLVKTVRERADSVHSADSLSAKTPNENIVIRKDEMLTSRTLELLNISAIASNAGSSRDSLPSKLAGVREDHTAGRQFRILEFWTSPLNYRGYKMNHNKLVLYGLPDSDGLKLYQLDDEIYLQNGVQTYHLEYGNDFRPYEKVNSEVLLSKLK
ncbi:MAG TPA: hypothetical protein VNZ86_12495 [Bacteroidia bacterium]|nr:hypothetical protein [Bacteroidia bacterium]